MIKMNQKNMKEYDKRKSHKSSKLPVIYISSNNVRHPVTKSFTTLHPTPLHYTFRHFTSSHLNFTHLNFLPLHFTSHHYTSPYFTLLHFSMIFATLLFLSYHPVYNGFPNPVSKNLRLTRESP